MTPSPLGRYSDLVAAIVAVILVVAAVGAHASPIMASLLGRTIPPVDTTWFDAVAGLAVGVVLGQRQTTNGAAKIAALAHARLDAIGAPPASTPPSSEP